jgi:hypothetical protein
MLVVAEQGVMEHLVEQVEQVEVELLLALRLQALQELREAMLFLRAQLV